VPHLRGQSKKTRYNMETLKMCLNELKFVNIILRLKYSTLISISSNNLTLLTCQENNSKMFSRLMPLSSAYKNTLRLYCYCAMLQRECRPYKTRMGNQIFECICKGSQLGVQVCIDKFASSIFLTPTIPRKSHASVLNLWHDNTTAHLWIS